MPQIYNTPLRRKGGGTFSVLSLCFFTFYSAFAATPKAVELYSSTGVVWGFSFLDKDRVFVSEREGSLYLYNLKTKNKIKFKTPKVWASGQGGLLDVKVKDIGGKKYVYVSFAEDIGEVVTTALSRATFEKNSLSSWEKIFQAKVKSKTSKHFGSRIVFKGEHLFMTVGDRGERQHAQDMSLHNGKIIRMKLDGSEAEIWSIGHRNPQGIDVDPVSKQLYSCEFGPRGGDELNKIEKNKNYGWPVITYGKEYWGPSIGKTHKAGMEQPLKYWVPSISPSGMVFYTGNRIKEWKNNLFMANLATRHLRRLVLKNGKVIQEEKLFSNLAERIRHVENSPDGYLYFSTDNGKIYKVQ